MGVIPSRMMPMGAAGGKPLPTARDYVQDGLVAMWDGIENAGWGVHDANATVWKDLIGSCDGTGTSVTWDDNCAIFNGTTTRFNLANQIPFSSQSQQIEAAFRLTTPYQASTIVNAGGNIGKCVVISASASKVVTLTRTSNDALGPLYPIDLGQCCLSVAFSGGATSAYQNAQALSQDGTGSVVDISSVAKIGCRQSRSGYGQFLLGRIYNMRVYSRALAADEIAHNYAIDKERFNLP